MVLDALRLNYTRTQRDVPGAAEVRLLPSPLQATWERRRRRSKRSLLCGRGVGIDVCYPSVEWRFRGCGNLDGRMQKMAGILGGIGSKSTRKIAGETEA
ncbi:hypothetical protein MRB53_008384 [Persea americana]|uniref:Uncharacterized protein n=1 Tax=Persea americana TaxID=3435 RepID=A0ACC2MLX1_PERAE|nr:hypothetical protein MRB53_008384 [Persea americana]